MTTLATPETLQIPKPVARPTRTLWNPRSIALIVFAWLVLQLGGIFSPGLLDDVDSIYIEVAREMLQRHDFVTPYINGIRFFDKPPLMYWMASTSMSVFGISDWAARLPLALAVLALLLSVYTLGNRLFAAISPTVSDRGGFYSALALATAIGPYLYTRFFIPDILIALWMTLGIHLFLIALERIQKNLGVSCIDSDAWDRPPHRSPLLPSLGFAAVLALNVLTKGLIGLVFPVAFVFLYLALTRQLRLIPRFHLFSSTAVFLAIAAPWHILAALRNPAVALPSASDFPPAEAGPGFISTTSTSPASSPAASPTTMARRPSGSSGSISPSGSCLGPPSSRQPSQLKYAPCATSASAAPKKPPANTRPPSRSFSGPPSSSASSPSQPARSTIRFPAIPALALMAGGLLASADQARADAIRSASRSALRWSAFFLTPIHHDHRRALRLVRDHRPAPRNGSNSFHPARQQPRAL